MRKKFTLSAVFTICIIAALQTVVAQNIFPSNGRAGIYTTSPAASLHVKGGARIGTLANYLNVDSATGSLSFVGTSAYRVAGNKYAFQYAGNPNYGLFFNSTNVQYEFRNGNAVLVFSVNANTGNSVFNGTLKVGAYTLPATDGTNGQVLKTNGAGVLTWNADNTGSSNGWSLTGNAGTVPGTNFIGTNDAKDLVIKTNNTERLRVLSTGNVGIGTLSPAARLHVKGNTNVSQLIIDANSTQSNTNPLIKLRKSDGTDLMWIHSDDATNSFVGLNAGRVNNAASGGIANTFTGSSAGYSNTLGLQNTANGFQALYSNTKGSYNSTNGYQALFSDTTGYYNTANGVYALYYATGAANTAIGDYAGFYITTGNNNVAVGDNAQVPDGTVSDQVRIGNEFIGYAGVQVAWTIISDRRWKSDIKVSNLGLNFIAKLKPVSYFRNNDKSKKREYGFIAQDLEEALNTSGAGNNGMISKDDKGMYGVRYNDLIAPMVKGMQELSKMNDEKDAKIDTLQKQNADLQKQFNDLKTLVLSIQQKQEQCSPCNASTATQAQSYSTILTDAVSLQQNIPNPFNHTTTIGYSLPQKFTNAQIIITDKLGNTLKAINISGSGKGTLNVDAATLASGAYNYSLLVDGKLVGTKQMVLAR